MSGSKKDPDGDPGSRRKSGDGDPPPQAGVLGNLPKMRPSVRSPRRTEAKPAAAKAEAATEASPPPAAEEEPPAAPKPPPRRPDGPSAEGEHSPAADLENLARGGIAIAGGAASLGLRMAGRAAAALRDAVERR